ncbi:uncharacterized protein PV09_00881 [Verruconis gallopava]|uniref:O-methyltransferase C-terminal domain-containing protein n=1 Tax=Verruconis gallopava TaxID=253628 RepID=A0A0D1Z7P3_9PEZI|nr:uncharacterized protein PV09_00881 [Verruconis gallopava]KIW08972.1 hypothetical protein PV09_00881 [Verruconis gallopava]
MASTATPSLNDLAFQISGLTYNISKFLEQNRHPAPSFAADGPPRFPDSAPAEIQVARQQLLELTLSLHNLILGPEERVRTQTAEYVNPATLRWIVHFKVAQHVPKEGSISYSDLAAATSLPENQLKRVLRYTMLNGYFFEPSTGQVAHSAMSLLLASSPSIQDYVSHAIEFSYPVSTKMVEMTEHYKGSDAKNETAFNVAFQTPLPMFAWLKGEPEHSERFGRLMGAMRAAPIYSVDHLVKGYDWGSLGAAKVVDVGGSLGHASLAVVDKYPDLNFVVQDLPEVVEQGRAKMPDSSAKKLEFMGHDFFNEQPIKDADVFLLRQILHDWADAEAITILKNLVVSMKAGSKILIMDQVVPPPGLLPTIVEKAGRTIDLVVMSHFNGKQRDLEDWKKIFSAADDRLVITNLIVQPGSVLSIIELSLQDAAVPNGHSTVAEKPTTNTENTEETSGTEQSATAEVITNGAQVEQDKTDAAKPVDEPSTEPSVEPVATSDSTERSTNPTPTAV